MGVIPHNWTDKQQQNKFVLFSCVQAEFPNVVSRDVLRPRSFRGRGASFLRFGRSGVLILAALAVGAALGAAAKCRR